MDSQDSSAPPPHHHHHHHHQTPFATNHAPTILLAQQHPSNNSYPLPNTTSSAPPTNSMINPRFPAMDHHYSDGSPSEIGGAWFNIDPPKKKRGRPRKYSPDNSIGLGLSAAPVPQIQSAAVDSGGGGGGGGGGGTPSSDTSNKRHRGRPPGSVKRQMDALGVPGVGFTPHVITVDSGEDVASKIMAFSQQGPRTVCILSANGAICNVTLRQPAMSGGTVTHQGLFEIISLSGSLLLSESNGGRSGSLSVSLAGPNGRVLGGGVAGMLKAASPVQVVVGSFIAEGGKKSKGGASPTPPPNMLNFAAPVTQASPSSPSDSGDDKDEDGSPGSGAYAGQAVHDVPIYSSMGWQNSIKMHPN